MFTFRSLSLCFTVWKW